MAIARLGAGRSARDPAAITEQFLGHVLGDRGALGVGDVDVDRRHESRVSMPVLAPASARSRRRGVGLVLPVGKRGALAAARNGRIAIGLHGQAELGGGHGARSLPANEKAPPAQCRRRGVLLFVKVWYIVVEDAGGRRVRLGHGIGGPAPDDDEHRLVDPADAGVFVLEPAGCATAPTAPRRGGPCACARSA